MLPLLLSGLGLSASPRALPEGVSSGGVVRYFAFGSNLLRSKMDKRGETGVIACTAGVVPDHRLAFNMRMFPPLEPSMASIEPSPGEVCEGALYTLTRDGYEALWQSEGGGMERPGYEEVSVPVSVDGTIVQAVTLRAAPWMRLRRDAPPSARYKELIVQGAVELGLSDAYVSMLSALPAASPSPALRALATAHGVVAALLLRLSAALGAPWARRVLAPVRAACYALLRAQASSRAEAQRGAARSASPTLVGFTSEAAMAAILLPTAALGASARLVLRACGREGWVRFGPPSARRRAPAR